MKELLTIESKVFSLFNETTMVSTNFWSETPDSGPRTFLSRYARFNRTYNQIGKCNNSLLSTLLFLFQPTPRQEKKKGKEEETNQLIKRGAQVKFIWKKGRGAQGGEVVARGYASHSLFFIRYSTMVHSIEPYTPASTEHASDVCK